MNKLRDQKLRESDLNLTGKKKTCSNASVCLKNNSSAITTKVSYSHIWSLILSFLQEISFFDDPVNRADELASLLNIDATKIKGVRLKLCII